MNQEEVDRPANSIKEWRASDGAGYGISSIAMQALASALDVALDDLFPSQRRGSRVSPTLSPTLSPKGAPSIPVAVPLEPSSVDPAAQVLGAGVTAARAITVLSIALARAWDALGEHNPAFAAAERASYGRWLASSDVIEVARALGLSGETFPFGWAPGAQVRPA